MVSIHEPLNRNGETAREFIGEIGRFDSLDLREGGNMSIARTFGIVAAVSILTLAALACSAQEAGERQQPQAPAPAAQPQAPVAPTGQQPAPAAQPIAPAAAREAAPAITAAPVAPQPKLSTPTPVPTPAPMAVSDWVAEYLDSDGYRPEWGDPVYGGIVKYGANLKLNGHDPNYGHTYEGPQFLPTYNSLIKYDPWQGLTGPIVPDLATTWEVSEGGTVITFTLRQGVTFQDNPNSTLPDEVKANIAGDEFTCEDAAASLDFAIYLPESMKEIGLTHTGPRLGLSHLKPRDEGGVSCPDGPMGYTLRTEFTEARAGTIGKFAGVTGMPNNMDKDLIAWWSTECLDCWDQTTDETYLYGTGTGAFMPSDRTQDVGTKIRANPDYWREGLPFLEGVDHIEIEDPTTRFTALITGQTDYYGEGSASLLPGQVEQVLDSFADEIHLEPVLHLWGKGLQFNMHREPFNDERVRYAIHLGIDRDDWAEFNRIKEQVGVVRPANWMPPGTVWALPDDELWEIPGFRRGAGKDADIAEANRLLDEAGYASDGGPRFSAACMTTAPQIFVDGCEWFQDQLSKNLNIELTVDIVEDAVQRQRGQTAHGEPPEYDVHYGSKARTDVADPSDFYNIFLIPETESWYHRGTGRFQADPERAQRLLDMAKAQAVELDPVKRREIVHDIEREVIDAAYMIPMPWTIIWPAWHTDVRGWRMFNHPSQIKWSGWERMWLAR